MSSRLCSWLSFRCLVSWSNHLPPVCWGTSLNASLNKSLSMSLTSMKMLFRCFLVLFRHIYIYFYLNKSVVKCRYNFFCIYLKFPSHLVCYVARYAVDVDVILPLRISVYPRAHWGTFQHKWSYQSYQSYIHNGNPIPWSMGLSKWALYPTPCHSMTAIVLNRPLHRIKYSAAHCFHGLKYRHSVSHFAKKYLLSQTICCQFYPTVSQKLLILDKLLFTSD